MEKIARLFNCTRCQSQITICTKCDRGNIYCKNCSTSARAESLRAASRRYQSTLKGRHNHAERQKRYRLKKINVTHQGSQDPPSDDLLSEQPRKQKEKNSVTHGRQCHFCGGYCSEFLRSRFLSHRFNYKMRSPPLRHKKFKENLI